VADVDEEEDAAGEATDFMMTTISKMYFSLWKPPEGSERMWSVNLGASGSGEYQSTGGHSGRPSEN